MKKKNDPMLLLDRRFLMDFLSEESLTDEPPPPQPVRVEPPSRERVLFHAKRYLDLSPRLAGLFINSIRPVLSLVSAEEFETWAMTGLDIADLCPDDTAIVKAFLTSSPTVLSAHPFGSFNAWANQGKKISESSTASAALFFHLTPLFLEHCDILHMKKWGDWGAEIVTRIQNGEHIATSYFHSSIHHLEFMTFREMKDWKTLGLNFSKRDPHLGDNYFKTPASGLEKLYWPERNILYRLTSFLMHHDPRQALYFFQNCPKQLHKIAPNIRDRLLEIIESLSKQTPGNLIGDFNSLANKLSTLSFPSQLIILEQTDRLMTISPDAARTFFQHASKILDHMPDDFLSHFVDHGIALHQKNESDLKRYFSASSDEAITEMTKWKNAVLLEDCQKTLALFARAMSGKSMAIMDASKHHSSDPKPRTLYPTTDGETMYLPPYCTGGKSREENFSAYKATTAHLAGLVEFGTFDTGIDLMINILSALPEKDLALDIFYILEDGRIDGLLRQHYRGLAADLNLAVEKGIAIRTSPVLLPVQEALVEVLLRLSLNKPVQNIYQQVPHFLIKPIAFLVQSLSGFYNTTRNTWDCFSKTFELYRYIRQFPNRLFSSLDLLLLEDSQNQDIHPYHRSAPFFFRGRVEHRTLPEPAELEVKNVEKADIPGGSPLSLEELQQLIDRLDTPLDILKTLDGKTLSAPGVFIKGIDTLVCRDVSQDSEKAAKQPKTKQAAILSSSQAQGPYYYDEWDYLQGAYRKRWCCLTEQNVDRKNQCSLDKIYEDYQGLIRKVKQQFQRIRPEVYQIVPRVDQGDEIDLSSLIQARVDKKAGTQPSDKIFIRKDKKIRKIAVLILVDMSASTGNPVSCLNDSSNEDQNNALQKSMNKKIIDIEIESLVVIMEALEALKDDYAIFGFSGYGKEKVDFYRIKDFSDTYSDKTKSRISSIDPKQSTRMGPAIRHAVAKLTAVESEQRLLILLSDGFPQDSDYGEDRSSHEYGLHDTMMALLEAKNQGIRPFCITIDPGANDYLKKMCHPSSYLVIQNIFSLPSVLPKVVESLIR